MLLRKKIYIGYGWNLLISKVSETILVLIDALDALAKVSVKMVVLFSKI
jgi:hypothetical protein